MQYQKFFNNYREQKNEEDYLIKNVKIISNNLKFAYN